MSTTATVLHPDPAAAPSVADISPPANFAASVAQSRQLVRNALHDQNLPGLSIAVGIDGKIVWAEGFGFADTENQIPVTPQHRFRIGTASAMLTSAAAGQLIDQGLLKLDEPIQTAVPEFREKQWPVTLRHLMAHTAGLPSDGGDESVLYGQHCEKPMDALPHFDGSPLLFPPGTQFRHSRYGWIVVSAAIEAAAGKPFYSAMRERVFDPLEMRDTLPESATQTIPNRATFYFPRFAADPKYGADLMRDLDYSCYAGAAAFLSTPSDLVRFAMAVNGGKLLRPETVRLLQSPQRLDSGQSTGHGLGWQLDPLGHNGDTLGGMAVSLLTFPEHRLAVAVTSNISYSQTSTLAAKIGQAFTPSAHIKKPTPGRRGPLIGLSKIPGNYFRASWTLGTAR